MQLPEFSLIIPVYQVKDYLVECLESVFCQIPADVQVILVDDGSTDGSGEICDQYAQKYPQIEVIHQRNQGVAAARNAGLAAAKGEYLLWVDPDDRVAKNWFLAIEQIVKKEAPDLIVFDSVRFSELEKKVERYGRRSGNVEKDFFVGDLLRDIRMLSGLPNKVFRRSAFQNLKFDTELQMLEDYMIMPLLLQRMNKIWYIPQALYEYRQRQTSLLHSWSPEKGLCCVELARTRQEKVPQCYKQSALIGTTVQAFFYCRTMALVSENAEQDSFFQKCKLYIHNHLGEICFDANVPVIWKIKIVLFDKNILIPIVRYKARRR
ncbi:MAG: glycosyltransferase family 2 protein [Eubacteriales bacterium]|nr:glycosyltransferase family 2 protein [Eubacteriales bacterium]